MFGCEANYGMAGDIDVFVGFVALDEHFDARVDQQRPEEIEEPGELLNEHRTAEDENESHDKCPQNAPEQYALEVFFLYAECEKDHDHDKKIVDREGFFDEIAGDVFEGKIAVVDAESLLIAEAIDVDGLFVFGYFGLYALDVGDAVNPLSVVAYDEIETNGQYDPKQ